MKAFFPSPAKLKTHREKQSLRTGASCTRQQKVPVVQETRYRIPLHGLVSHCQPPVNPQAPPWILQTKVHLEGLFQNRFEVTNLKEKKISGYPRRTQRTLRRKIEIALWLKESQGKCLQIPEENVADAVVGSPLIRNSNNANCKHVLIEYRILFPQTRSRSMNSVALLHPNLATTTAESG